jgi:uncharacterized membrane protein YuzA (DUF378 family)
MRYLNLLALLLVIVGGVRLLIGLARIDLVAAVAGVKFGETNAISSAIYLVVGLGAAWLLPTLARWAAGREATAAR